jgi:hypothetical protein
MFACSKEISIGLCNGLGISARKDFSFRLFKYAVTMAGSKSQAFYAVRIGRERGIYSTWAECETQVRGYQGGIFKKFLDRSDAEQFMQAKTGNNGTTYKAKEAISRVACDSSDPIVPKKRLNSKICTVYTDGSCVGPQNARKAGLYVRFSPVPCVRLSFAIV